MKNWPISECNIGSLRLSVYTPASKNISECILF